MSATLDSKAACTDRAETMGTQEWIIRRFSDRRFATFGKLAFAYTYSPPSATDEPLKKFITDLLEEKSAEDQLAALRRLYFFAMDLAGLATFGLTKSWTLSLFTQLLKEQPKGFAQISLRQLMDCVKHMWITAFHMSIGKLSCSLVRRSLWMLTQPL